MEERRRIVLIPAAGESARFRAAGYEGPKAGLRIDLGGVKRRMLDHVIENLPPDCEPVVVTRREWAADLKGPRQILFDGTTRGQTETVLRGLQAVGPCSVLIHNCDVLIDASTLHQMTRSSDFGIALHEDLSTTEPPPFSYADNPTFPRRFAEKERISTWAVSGAWWFNWSTLLTVCCSRQLQEQPSGEAYLSGALRDITLQAFPCRFVDLGTPEAVAAAGGIIG